jgi:hypothetical protein
MVVEGQVYGPAWRTAWVQWKEVIFEVKGCCSLRRIKPVANRIITSTVNKGLRHAPAQK